MELLLTIEISPCHYTCNEYELLHYSPDAVNEFWLKCLSDSNLGHLKAIETGSYLVDIETIGDAELEEIIKKKLEDVELEDYDEQVSGIMGGIVVKENNKLLIVPSCCGDLSTIDEWEAIFDNPPTRWNQLWIGHPWVYYKRENGMIEFSDYTELNSEDLQDQEMVSVIQLPEKELKSELTKLRKQQSDFGDRIRETLENRGIKKAKEISYLMTGKR